MKNMKHYIISIFLLLSPISVFSQQTDTYLDSLFHTNIKMLYDKCEKDFQYDPVSDKRMDLYYFLVIFQHISLLDIIGIPYLRPLTDYDKIRNLEEWYKKYGCCITKQDYLGFKRLIDDIESFSSFDEYTEFQDELFETIEKKISDYELKLSCGQGNSNP